MKPLILSFFGVILCYSLFIDDKQSSPEIDTPGYSIRSEMHDPSQVPDSVLLYADWMSGNLD